MLRPLRLLWQDATLRIAAAALMLTGCLAASIAPYQSLLAIRLFDLSDGAYAAVLAAAAVVSVAGAVAIGILTDQTAARKRIALWTATLILLGNGLVMAAPGKVTFVAAHAVILPLAGTLFGQVFALARLAATRHGPTERDSALAAIRALFALPFIVILPLWSWAFDRGLGLVAIYPAIFGIGLATVALIWRHWPRDGQGDWDDAPSGLGLRASLSEIGARPVLIRVALAGVINSGSFLYMIVLGLTFDESTGRDIGDVAIFAGLVAGLEVPVMLCMGALLRTMSRLHAILLGTALYAGFLFAFPVLLASPAVWLLVVPAAVGGGIVLSLPIAYVQDLMGSRAGAGGALLAVQKVAAEGLGAGIFALATLISGYALGAILGGAAMLAGALALLWLDGAQPVRKPGPA